MSLIKPLNKNETIRVKKSKNQLKQKKGEGCFQFMWDTLIVYGSFTEPQPDQNNHDVMFRFPNKFEVCDKSKAEFF